MNKFLKAALVALALSTPAHADDKHELEVFFGLTACGLIEQSLEHEAFANFYVKMLVKRGKTLDIDNDRFELITDIVAEKLSTKSALEMNEYHQVCHDAVLASLT